MEEVNEKKNNTNQQSKVSFFWNDMHGWAIFDRTGLPNGRVPWNIWAATKYSV